MNRGGGGGQGARGGRGGRGSSSLCLRATPAGQSGHGDIDIKHAMLLSLNKKKYRKMSRILLSLDCCVEQATVEIY